MLAQRRHNSHFLPLQILSQTVNWREREAIIGWDEIIFRGTIFTFPPPPSLNTVLCWSQPARWRARLCTGRRQWEEGLCLDDESCECVSIWYCKSSINYFCISELLLALKVIKPACGAWGAAWFGLTASWPPVLYLKSLHAASSESSERQGQELQIQSVSDAEQIKT